MCSGAWLHTVIEPLSYDTLMAMTTAYDDYDDITILVEIVGWYSTFVARNGERFQCMTNDVLSRALISLRIRRDVPMHRFPVSIVKLKKLPTMSTISKLEFLGFVTMDVVGRVDGTGSA